MNTETMNIRAGLKERKTLDLRIAKIAGTIDMARAYCVDDNIIGLYTPEEYEEKMKSEFQSLEDMIRRREAINAGLLKINAETMIKVPKFISFSAINNAEYITGEEEISLATAIARKAYYKDQLFNVVSVLYKTVNKNIKEVDEVKRAASMKISEAVNKRFSDTNQTNIAKTTYDDFMQAQEKKYEVKLLNPIDCSKTLQNVMDSINDYIQNIDNKLSEKTETTEFTITY